MSQYESFSSRLKWVSHSTVLVHSLGQAVSDLTDLTGMSVRILIDRHCLDYRSHLSQDETRYDKSGCACMWLTSFPTLPHLG